MAFTRSPPSYNRRALLKHKRDTGQSPPTQPLMARSLSRSMVWRAYKTCCQGPRSPTITSLNVNQVLRGGLVEAK